MGTLTIKLGAAPIKVECETGKVSDGYHTFDELYDHRCLLFLAWQETLRLWGLPGEFGDWKSRRHADGSSYEGWFIAGVRLPQGQISYHIPNKYWDSCNSEECQTAPEWDGHTSADVVERLMGWLNG